MATAAAATASASGWLAALIWISVGAGIACAILGVATGWAYGKFSPGRHHGGRGDSATLHELARALVTRERGEHERQAAGRWEHDRSAG